MKIAVINETSAADKNNVILEALDGRGHEVINVGMTKNGAKPELSYIQTGFLTGILLHLKRVDLVVGGCGTGQGFYLSAMQYPDVFCGHIKTPLDAWLFTQINGGNAISLALHQGYGWAGEVNIRFIFDRYFSVDRGSGYPKERSDVQTKFRNILSDVSKFTHYSYAELVETMPDYMIKPALEYPGVLKLLDIDTIKEDRLKSAFEKRLQ